MRSSRKHRAVSDGCRFRQHDCKRNRLPRLHSGSDNNPNGRRASPRHEAGSQHTVCGSRHCRFARSGAVRPDRTVRRSPECCPSASNRLRAPRQAGIPTAGGRPHNCFSDSDRWPGPATKHSSPATIRDCGPRPSPPHAARGGTGPWKRPSTVAQSSPFPIPEQPDNRPR